MRIKKHIKKEIRILGIDDAPFSRKQKKVLCVGTIYRGGSYIDGLISFHVQNDGNDATSKIIKAINKTKHKDQLQYIMLDGICVAGFNMINIQQINKKTKLPVIVIMRKMPQMKKFRKALSNIDKSGQGLKAIAKAGKIHKIKIKSVNKKTSDKINKNLYIQLAGISKDKAKKILEISCTHSNIPEPIRVAHLIASGIATGENIRRA